MFQRISSLEDEQARGKGGKERMMGAVNMIEVFISMYENIMMKSTKTVKKKGWGSG
jgi:hypothetical protein